MWIQGPGLVHSRGLLRSFLSSLSLLPAVRGRQKQCQINLQTPQASSRPSRLRLAMECCSHISTELLACYVSPSYGQGSRGSSPNITRL